MTDRLSLEARVRAEGLAPMWTRPKAYARPQSVCTPQVWRYAVIRSLLLEAASQVSHEDSERRVLILENPGLQGRYILSPTLFAGVQILMPGEAAPPHRHTQAALRFVLEGAGAFATVGDERIPLEAGDLVVNPRWDWHSHEHVRDEKQGGSPAIWLDILDNPIVRTMEADFRQWPSDAEPPLARDSQRSAKRFPYGEARAALERAGAYIYPMGLPTITTSLQKVRGAVPKRRTTETQLFLVAEGNVSLRTETQAWPLELHDIAFVPPWTPYELDGDGIVFTASNREALTRLELLREE